MKTIKEKKEIFEANFLDGETLEDSHLRTTFSVKGTFDAYVFGWSFGREEGQKEIAKAKNEGYREGSLDVIGHSLKRSLLEKVKVKVKE